MESYFNKSLLSARIERIKGRDSELLRELESRLQPPQEVSLRSAKRMVRESVEAPPVRLRARTSSHPQPVEESIVLAHLRPVLIIRDNKIVPEFSGPEMSVWKDRLLQQEPVLNTVIPSVGRVEINNNAVYSWVGTGWLIDTDIMVTNRHVANIFCKNKEGFAFKMGYPSGEQTSRIDFLEEYQRSDQLEFDIDSVLWIAENDPKQPDVAFMRLKNKRYGPQLPHYIELADSVDEGEVVVTIGYPARDPNIPDQEVVLSIFGNVYDKKRLAPGEIIKVDDKELEHDCSTLGGNSGSAVISLATGKAVGLHFAGLYLQRNFAVPSHILKELLTKLKAGTLPRMSTSVKTSPADESSITSTSQNSNQTTTMPSQIPGKFTIETTIPIKVTLEIGDNNNPVISQIQTTQTPGTNTGNTYEQAVAAAKQLLGNQPGVISVRKGYRFKRGWITDERVIVVEVQEKQSLPDLRKAGKQLFPQEFLGFGIDVRTASLGDQLGFQGVEMPGLEAVPKPGIYREPPELQLDPVTDEQIKAIFHVSPDCGWPNLHAFFQRIKHNLTATIYEWEAQHISDALYTAINSADGHLKMVTQKPGTQEAVEEMQQKLKDNFEHVWASVGAGKIVPSAYHIKVASRDDEEFWLSSGNWKDSNQADIDPAGEHSTSITPLREHNREWHVIMENSKLATMFREYIDWDFEEAQRVPLEEAPSQPETYVFVPEQAMAVQAEQRITAQYFEPLTVDKVLNVQPLLTPDRDSRGNRIFIEYATNLIDTATASIDIENQSFSLITDNDPQFESFFNVLLRKQNEGIKIRVIFRDPREFGGGAKAEESLHKQLERLKEFGLNTDNIKVQTKCHTKAIIVDSGQPDTAAVLFGSHNLTNSGALFNRDASLQIKDQEVAQYFQNIFNFDWEVLAEQNAEESTGGIRIAQAGEETPAGFRKVALSELLSAG
jgi:S1-C subfamily serine protease